MYGKSNMETYITICKIDSQQEFAVCLRELKQGLCINLEGWDGEGDGSGYNAGVPGSIPESGRSPGVGNGNPLQYPCLKIAWTEGPGGLQSMGS